MKLPTLYAILDAACFQNSDALFSHARALAGAGVTLFQYRNKTATARQMLADARELRRLLPDATLVMNDRADLAIAASFNGVHVGQDDLSIEAVRAVVGDRLFVGVSTHNPEQVRDADLLNVDYIAVGPVFSTVSKANPDPVIGVEGVRRARELTRKPLVAIGGITRATAADVLSAGANSLAIIGDLLHDPQQAAAAFLSVR